MHTGLRYPMVHLIDNDFYLFGGIAKKNNKYEINNDSYSLKHDTKIWIKLSKNLLMIY